MTAREPLIPVRSPLELGEPVVKTNVTHVAMDTHKKQHPVAWGHPETGEIQEFTVLNRTREIERMVKRIRQQVPGEIHVCYEAGICGFVLQRRLEKLGCVCPVIAPSLVCRQREIGSRRIGAMPASC